MEKSSYKHYSFIHTDDAERQLQLWIFNVGQTNSFEMIAFVWIGLAFVMWFAKTRAIPFISLLH